MRADLSVGTHILVVDDEAEIRNGVAEYLATHGFSVETAADGVAMRQRLEERPADLVLLDLRMPGEDACRSWVGCGRAARR